ncbi:conserved Plasmodium protein, unknown function [Plasmodium berghei]|uniref:Uncharacterized protein n=2 Tax=Plasmodium berghei TaxID=5821 RepID=A0A509AQ83_PLABA|nr:conserved protein, unknown function [Plasmodium berghei ANKA]CXJ00028.1 conserved Plasmodium protein, unknown function [Plasmodium berghei]SCL97946.1 conserved Plasmodium protein, unknown function [Plasmodium berghei]SCM16718.1 conserved Plasmodium protein, unknown function [Plasmodium berghei]SCN27949.1 conserved Plasmodium protein, unknown function [Plasmodium berghei]VUC57832.1 conserved protein, unknown function [Plasmodium berghei ANKA]|eukprot:XP_034423602.1 conserved protein, unknown function [Plasmodium berghei ANKA]
MDNIPFTNYVVNKSKKNSISSYNNANNCADMDINTKYKLYKDRYYEPQSYFIEKNMLINNNCITENTMNSTYDSNLINNENDHSNNKSPNYCEVMPHSYACTHGNSENEINENRHTEINHIMVDKHRRNSIDTKSENSASNLSIDHNKINTGVELLTSDYGQIDIKHIQKFGDSNRCNSMNYNNHISQIKQYNNNNIPNKNEIMDLKKNIANNNMQQLFNNHDYPNYRKTFSADSSYNKKNYNFYDINNNRFFVNENNMKNKYDTYYNELYYDEQLKDDNTNFENKNNININNMSRPNVNNSFIDISGNNAIRPSKNLSPNISPSISTNISPSISTNISPNIETININYINDIDKTNNIPSNFLRNYYYNMYEEEDSWDYQIRRNASTPSQQPLMNISHHFYSSMNSSSNSSIHNNSYANSNANSNSVNIYSGDSSIIGPHTNIESETASIYLSDHNMMYTNPLYLNMNNSITNPHGYRTDMNLEHAYNNSETPKETNVDAQENKRGGLGSNTRRGNRGRRARGTGIERTGSIAASTKDVTKTTNSIGRIRGRGRGSIRANQTGRTIRSRVGIRSQRGGGKSAKIEIKNTLDEISKNENSEEISINNLNDVNMNNSNNFTNENNNLNKTDTDEIADATPYNNEEDTVIIDAYTTVIDLTSNSNHTNTIENKCDNYENQQSKIYYYHFSFYNMSFIYAKGNTRFYNFNSSIRKNYIKFKNNYYKKKKMWCKYNAKRIYAYLLKNNKKQSTILHTNNTFEYNYNKQNKMSLNNENDSININKSINDMPFCDIQNGDLALEMDKKNQNQLICSTPKIKNNKFTNKINHLGFYLKHGTLKAYRSRKYNESNTINDNKEVNVNFENENNSDDACVYRYSFQKKNKKNKKIYNICNEGKHFCKYLSDDDISYENYFNYFCESATSTATISTYFLYFKILNKKKLRQKVTSMNPKKQFNYNGFLNSFHTKNDQVNEEDINGYGNKNITDFPLHKKKKQVKNADSENELNSAETHISYKENKLNILDYVDANDSIFFDANHIFVTCCENLLINKKIKTHYLNYFVERLFNVHDDNNNNDSVYYNVPKIKINKCNNANNISSLEENTKENISDPNEINDVTVKSEELPQNKKSGGFFFNTNFFFSKKNETEKKGGKFLSLLFSRKKTDDNSVEKNDKVAEKTDDTAEKDGVVEKYDDTAEKADAVVEEHGGVVGENDDDTGKTGDVVGKNDGIAEKADEVVEKNETQKFIDKEMTEQIENIQYHNFEKYEKNSIKEKTELSNNRKSHLLKSILPNNETLNYQNMERKYTYEYNNRNVKLEKMNDKTYSLTDINIERANETAHIDQDEMGVYGNNGYDYFIPNKNMIIHNDSHIHNFNYNMNNNNNYYNSVNTHNHNNYECNSSYENTNYGTSNYGNINQFKRQQKMQIDNKQIDNKQIDNKQIDNKQIDNEQIDNEQIYNEQIKIRKRRKRSNFNINNSETMRPDEDSEPNNSNNVMYKHIKSSKNTNDISQLHFKEIKNMLKDLTILQSGPNWKTYKMDGLPKDLFKNIRPINQRVTGFKTVLLVDDLFEKLWEFPNTDIIKVRTVTRGDQFIGDIRIDFYYKQSERTLCRACGRHILKQKFATEHYQRNIYCWKEVMWRIGIPELYYYNTIRNESYPPRIEMENNEKQAMLEKTLFMYNQDLIKKATNFVNKELKYYEDNVVSKQKKSEKKKTLELDILILENNNIILPTIKNEIDEPYFEISGIYPNNGFPDENTLNNFCYIKIAFNKLGGMVLRDLFILECEFLVDWGDNLLIQAKKYTLHEAFNNPNLYDVNLRNLYDQGFAYLRCNIPPKNNKIINLKVRIPKTVWHYWEAIADNSFKINYEFLDKQNAHKQLLCYLYMDNTNKNGTPTLAPPSSPMLPKESENHNIEKNQIASTIDVTEYNRSDEKNTEITSVDENIKNLNKQQHQPVINSHYSIDNMIPSSLLKKDDIINGSEADTSTSGTSMTLTRSGTIQYINNNQKNKCITHNNGPISGGVGNIQIDYINNKTITHNDFNGMKSEGEYSYFNKKIPYNNSTKPYTNFDSNMITGLPYKNF